MSQPPEGITTKCVVTRVIDGDTVDVEIRRKLRVRLQDCWAPELRNEGGPQSRDHLSRLVGMTPIVLHIPADDDGEIKDVFTFGRIVGELWKNGVCLNRQMVEDGFAVEEKP